MATSDASLWKQIEELQKQVQSLTAQLQKKNVVRQKIDVMSSEVVDSNPYRYEKSGRKKL
jgi:hypothetical protein